MRYERQDCRDDEVVDIVKGKHKGKIGTYLKRTPQKIQIRIDGNEKPIYLNPESIKFRSSGLQTLCSDEVLAENPTFMSDRNKMRLQQILVDDDFVLIEPVSRQEMQFKNSMIEAPSVSTSNDFTSGVIVDIVSGKYKGKLGTLLKRTSQKFYVHVDGNDKPCYLSPASVKFQCPDEETIYSDAVSTMSSSIITVRSTSKQVSACSGFRPIEYSTNQEIQCKNTLTVDSPTATSQEFVHGTIVDIVKGKHTGKVGTFLKRTPQKVQINVKGSDKPCYLDPECIKCQSSGIQRILFPDELTEKSTSISARNKLMLEQLSVDTNFGKIETISSQEMQFEKSLMEAPSVLTTHDFTSGLIVDIVSGTYEGKVGTLLKRTSQRCYVHVDGYEKPCYLSPNNIKLRCSDLQTMYSDTASTTSTAIITGRSMSEEVSVNSCFYPIENTTNQEIQFNTPTTIDSSIATNQEFTRGTIVDIVNGKHKGKVGTFLKRTSQKVQIHVKGEDKPCYLDPDIIHFRSSTLETDASENFSVINHDNIEHSKSTSKDQKTFASHYFGDRLRKYTIEDKWKVDTLPVERVEDDGSIYQLLTVKCLRKKIDAYYVLASGATVGLQDELGTIAGFGFLPPDKVAPRLQLLFTPTYSENGLDLFFENLNEEQFERIPEVANEGCGFIPSSLIRKFVGTLRNHETVFALQVRIYSSKLGIFKGVLFEKPGISKIQLPDSMLKVPPAKHLVSDKVCLLVNHLFPSKVSQSVSKILQGIAPSNTFKPRELTEMLTTALRERDVPEPVVNMYMEKVNCHHGFEHCSLVGLADPTNCIPAGWVFITGISSAHAIGNEVFITRYPCTNDGKKLFVIKDKPDLMSYEQYEWLNGLAFGGIVFGNPGVGDKPMPTMIANGDLDGDLYFVCWSREILHFVTSTNDTTNSLKSNCSPACEWNPSWLSRGQNDMSDIKGSNLRGKIIGRLHKLWQELFRKNGPRCDLVSAFGSGYKLSLELQKHGGKIPLPADRISSLPKEFHPLIEPMPSL